MELTVKEVAEINGGNWFFARVAESIRHDLMEEGQMFEGQGVRALWEESTNLFTRAREIVLRIESEKPHEGGIVIGPTTVYEDVFGLHILVNKNGSHYGVAFYKDKATEFTALETARTIIVARFGIENRREY